MHCFPPASSVERVAPLAHLRRSPEVMRHAAYLRDRRASGNGWGAKVNKI
ncbi:hypothetical protein ANDO1_0789 [plant metagenome]|uniref:Uncharacterized protein n=1 Tax=plant metagenome TaxID=1297885 RepID=A0A484Q345_9ZZZZ